ncbi:MAG TPA: alpha/beta hydrolase [Gemmatimonadales bacterium]|nr:alpha/beta hydrolase [Gemmatimonadales bacterium]
MTDRSRLGAWRARAECGALVLALLAALPVVGAGQDVRGAVSAAGLAYDVVGRGDPVVLIHGFALDRRMWEPQMTGLTEAAPAGASFQVIRYDLRGHGRSTASFADSFAHHDDLARLLDELVVRRAAVVGFSLGARVAVDFALAYPERVSGLVLAGPSISGYVARERPAGIDSVFAAVRSGDTRRAAWSFAQMPMMVIRSDTAMHAFMRGIVLDNAAIWDVRSNPERALTPPAIVRLGALTVPVLLIAGDEDIPDILRTADAVVAGTGGRAQKAVLPGVGHMVNLAAPAQFNELMLDFLRPRGR